MTLDQLVIFCLAAETLNFSEVARCLHQSQPSISQHVKSLEAELEVTLFTRIGRKLQLSDAGEKLYPYARRMCQEFESATATLGEMKQEISGPLRIGASTTNGSYLLPSILIRFKQLYPKVDILMTFGNSTRLVQEFGKGYLHLLLLEGPKPEIKEKTISLRNFYTDNLVLIKSPGLKHSAIRDFSDLRHLPWVLREPESGTRQVLLAYLKKNGILYSDLKVMLELGSTEAVKRSLIAGDGIACTSALVVERELAQGQLQELIVPGWNIHRPLWLMTLQEKYLNATSKIFIQYLYQAVQKIK